MPNQYFISRSAFKTLQRAAHAAGIHEICYVVFGSGSRVSQLVRVPNRADESLHHVIDADDVEKVRCCRSARRYKLLGLLHTHPLSDALPGEGDIRGYSVGSLVFIYSDDSKKLRAFRMTGKGVGYIERPVHIVKATGE